MKNVKSQVRGSNKMRSKIDLSYIIDATVKSSYNSEVVNTSNRMEKSKKNQIETFGNDIKVFKLTNKIVLDRIARKRKIQPILRLDQNGHDDKESF